LAVLTRTTQGVMWSLLNKMIEQIIVGATGLGYLIVGVLQWAKGEPSNGMIWVGYAFAQVGLWLNLK